MLGSHSCVNFFARYPTRQIDVQEADIDRSLPPAEPRLQEESADELTHSESEGDSD